MRAGEAGERIEVGRFFNGKGVNVFVGVREWARLFVGHRTIIQSLVRSLGSYPQYENAFNVDPTIETSQRYEFTIKYYPLREVTHRAKRDPT